MSSDSDIESILIATGVGGAVILFIMSMLVGKAGRRSIGATMSNIGYKSNKQSRRSSR